jgi:hypothetical protein
MQDLTRSMPSMTSPKTTCLPDEGENLLGEDLEQFWGNQEEMEKKARVETVKPAGDHCGDKELEIDRGGVNLRCLG